MVRKIFWRSRKHTAWGLALMTATLFLLAACGGGGGGGTTTGDVSALSLPDRIELSNVQDQAGSARTTGSFGTIARGAYDDADSDYSNAVKRSWVDDTDALDMINTVLGICKDTGYDNYVNQGAYKALVRSPDESKQSQSGSSTTSTTTEQLAEIYVDVTRASNDDPMIVKIWLLVNGPGDQPMLVRGYFSVSEGVSDEYPFGAMVAHFKGSLLDDNGNIIEGAPDIMNMSLSVSAENGQVIIENVDDEEGGQYVSHRKVRVEANAAVTEGNAYVSDQQTNCDQDGCVLPDATILQIAFNADYFQATEEGETPVVFAKDQLSHRIFRYQLFDATTGAAVTRNSGFPIQTQDGKNGYMGYYGLWAPNGVSIANGDTVTNMDGDEYTVFKAAGKLIKHTRSSMLLSALTNVELSKYSCMSGPCVDQIVRWNGSNFEKIGQRNQSNGQIVYDGTPTPIDNPAFQQWEGAWCESLKAFLRLGSLYYDRNTGNPTTPTNDSTVYYHAEQTLSPSEAADLTLYTWSFTLGLPVDQTVIDGSAAAQSTYWSNPQSEKTFHFVASEMMLYSDDGAGNPNLAVTMTDPSLDLTGTQYQFGYQFGPLTTAHYYNDHSPFQWEANDAEVYYTWSTGTDQWNQYVTVVDGNGDFVAFDAPISFSYTHTTANDVNGASSNNNKTFRIEYDGFSVNIPWAFDPDSRGGEWTPLINIADGTLMGPNGNDYVIKGLEEALIMTPTSDTPDLTEENVGAPTLTYDATKTALVGAIPTGVELKVIKGEVIE